MVLSFNLDVELGPKATLYKLKNSHENANGRWKRNLIHVELRFWTQFALKLNESVRHRPPACTVQKSIKV